MYQDALVRVKAGRYGLRPTEPGDARDILISLASLLNDVCIQNAPDVSLFPSFIYALISNLSKYNSTV